MGGVHGLQNKLIKNCSCFYGCLPNWKKTSVCSDSASFWPRITRCSRQSSAKVVLKRKLLRTGHWCIPGTEQVRVLYLVEHQMWQLQLPTKDDLLNPICKETLDPGYVFVCASIVMELDCQAMMWNLIKALLSPTKLLHLAAACLVQLRVYVMVVMSCVSQDLLFTQNIVIARNFMRWLCTICSVVCNNRMSVKLIGNW